MDVEIVLGDSSLTVRDVRAGATSVVRPGEKWEGWKYSRLRRRGSGRHTLVTKAAKQSPMLKLRGHE